MRWLNLHRAFTNTHTHTYIHLSSWPRIVICPKVRPHVRNIRNKTSNWIYIKPLGKKNFCCSLFRKCSEILRILTMHLDSFYFCCCWKFNFLIWKCFNKCEAYLYLFSLIVSNAMRWVLRETARTQAHQFTFLHAPERSRMKNHTLAPSYFKVEAIFVSICERRVRLCEIGTNNSLTFWCKQQWK